MSFIKDLVKASGNEYANIVAEGVSAGDVDSFVDTGSYIFNALLSGSLYGGLPAIHLVSLCCCQHKPQLRFRNLYKVTASFCG